MNLKKIISVDLLLLAIIPLIYIISWDNLFLSTLLSVSAVIILLFLYHKPIDILYFSFGFFFGSIGEIACVYLGVWEYTKPFIFGIPLWLSLFWGYAFLLINRFMKRILKNEGASNKKQGILFLFVVYLSLILIPSIMKENNALTLIGLILVLVPLLFKPNREDIFFAFFFSVLGVALEILCIYFGLWKYSNPDIFGIPLWLPFLYADFSLFIKKAVKRAVLRL